MKKLGLILFAAILLFAAGCRKKDMKYHLFGKTYNSLEEVELSDIREYARILEYLYSNEKSYETFTDEDITIYVASKFMMSGSTVTDREVKEFVESFFGRKNFKIKEGVYDYSKYVEGVMVDQGLIITRDGNTLSSNLGGFGPLNNFVKPTKKVENDTIILHYLYGHEGPKMDELVEEYGTADVYFEYQSGNLILEKILYTPKKL